MFSFMAVRSVGVVVEGEAFSLTAERPLTWSFGAEGWEEVMFAAGFWVEGVGMVVGVASMMLGGEL